HRNRGFDARQEVGQVQHLARGSGSELEARLLEDEVSRIQRSNLIRARNEYFLSNALRLDSALPASGGTPAPYSEEIAQRQVEVLQKARAVSARRVRPVHAGVPVGARLSPAVGSLRAGRGPPRSTAARFLTLTGGHSRPADADPDPSPERAR